MHFDTRQISVLQELWSAVKWEFIVEGIFFDIVNFIIISRIWCSHGGEYEEGCLLGCSAMQSGRSLPTFTHHPDDGGNKDLWNVGKLLPDYMVL
jgi:hypothetical protein